MQRNLLQVLVFVALAMGGFAIGTTEFGTMSLLPLIQSSYAIDQSSASHIISMYALGVVVGAPLITVVAARMPRKTMLIITMLLFALGNGLSALAPGYGWLMLFRFISGLPHGAYFGLASLVAASLVGPYRRTQAVGYVMLGLTVATILGVPMATWLGDMAGWRAGFWAVTALALVACVMIMLFAPHQGGNKSAHPKSELEALARINVWLTLSIGAIGFGGSFAVYTYLTTTLHEVTHMSSALAPVVLGLYGVGMTLGNLVVPYFADRAQMPTSGVILVGMIIALLAFPMASHHSLTVMIDVFCLGFATSLASIIQTRLMEVSGEAKSLAAAMQHVAFNFANALGPFLTGLVIAAGYGAEVAGYVGAVLAFIGLVLWAITWAYDKHIGHNPHAPLE